MTCSYDDIKQAVVKAGPQVDVDKLKPETKFRDVGVDSLDMFNIIFEVQNISGIEVPNSDFEQLDSLENVFNYVQHRLKE